MTRRVPVPSNGYVGLILAAFALLIVIVASPLLQRAWTPFTTTSTDDQQRSERLLDQGAVSNAKQRG